MKHERLLEMLAPRRRCQLSIHQAGLRPWLRPLEQHRRHPQKCQFQLSYHLLRLQGPRMSSPACRSPRWTKISPCRSLSLLLRWWPYLQPGWHNRQMRRQKRRCQFCPGLRQWRSLAEHQRRLRRCQCQRSCHRPHLQQERNRRLRKVLLPLPWQLPCPVATPPRQQRCQCPQQWHLHMKWRPRFRFQPLSRRPRRLHMNRHWILQVSCEVQDPLGQAPTQMRLCSKTMKCHNSVELIVEQRRYHKCDQHWVCHQLWLRASGVLPLIALEA